MANLNYEELQNILTELTFKIKGLDYNSTDQNVQKLVRRAYVTDSQPFNNISDDTTYFWFSLVDDVTNSLLEKTKKFVQLLDEKGEVIAEGIEEKISQARVLEVIFIFYGDKAFDSSQNARLNLFKTDTYNFLKKNDIYLRREVEVPKYTFENIQNRWWRRADFIARFNLNVESVENINNLTQVDVDVNSIEAVKNIIIKEE